MKLPSLAALFGAVAAAEAGSSSLFSNKAESASKIPSSYDSAVMGRRILALSKLADLATVFPSSTDGANAPDSLGYIPEGLGGIPVGLMDYVADCESEGNPTLLAIKIATSFKNVEAGSNMTLSMRWIPPYPPAHRMSFLSRVAGYVPYFNRAYGTDSASNPDPVPYSAANLPRFSLIGYVEPIQADPVSSAKLASCFTAKHHEARWWLPGNVIHESEWARLVVTHVYWVGGFGDRAYIGWIPMEEWKSVSKEEWSKVMLPGEKKGWSEWSVSVDEL